MYREEKLFDSLNAKHHALHYGVATCMVFTEVVEEEVSCSSHDDIYVHIFVYNMYT